MRWHQQGKDVINLGIGQPDFRTPDHIVEAAIKALRDGHHGYTPATGTARHPRGGGAPTLPRQASRFRPMNRDDHAGRQADHVRRDPDVRRARRGHPLSRSRLSDLSLDDRIHRRRPVPVPIREENGFAFSAEETLSLITPKTRLLILNSPANPTGGVTPRAEIEKLVKGLEQHPDVAIMSDEIYDVMTYDGETHTSLLHIPEIRDRLIVLNGWSKTWAMTGWRMGWSIWPNSAESGHLYDKVASSRSIAGPASMRRASLRASPPSTARRTRSRTMMKAFDRRRKTVVEGLNAPARRFLHHAEGCVLRIPQRPGRAGRPRNWPHALLEETGVALIGGPDFGILGEGYLRLSYANSEENILRALERMHAFLTK
jgi:aspartate aminotransferase